MGHRLNLSGKVFGDLSVLGWGFSKKTKGKVRGYWLVVCICGEKKHVQTNALTSGKTKSCGCLKFRTKNNLQHGMSRMPIYSSWQSMMGRCYNKRNYRYSDYGGRGIVVCDKWHTFLNFYKDMGDAPSKQHTLDRTDNDKGYSPENCRWATYKEQSRNRRFNVRVVYKNESLCISEVAEKYNIPEPALRHRLRSGWSVNDSIETPIRKKGNKYGCAKA